ncbi:DNA internalization-related competence protein ComEC/Rec2 [Gilvimarinus chinensis]|uniref:DNA internalization-related competence protein ComEC/Rec2 n=1 Tax=Gilvimarinus chinensis TaxID=396005 RepID=UPI000688222C|nr:DNA internalization-related competence protein ComEC/Rec2 [Gilvimarinus chinensis]
MIVLCLLLAVLFGLVLPGFLPSLIPLWAPFLCGVCSLGISQVCRKRVIQHAAMLSLGFSVAFVWSTYYGQQLVAQLLPDALIGQDIQVEGAVTDIDVSDERRLRFLLTPQMNLSTPDATQAELPPRIQLSWYGAPPWARQLQAGDTITVNVRLKRPRSFINPVGFDYRLWQLRRGVGATGYVRSDGRQALLASGSDNSIRTALRQWLIDRQPQNPAVLRALLLGERDLITDAQWQLFRATGTSHLIAISGLHIGLAAGLGYALGMLLGRVLVLFVSIPAVVTAMLLGALSAWAYAALAGFALPTQRALAMLLLFYAARCTGRLVGAAVILLLAATLVLTLEPLSVFDAGFWLSFLAVGALVMVFSGVLSLRKSRWWQLLWRPQWVAFVALLAPLALFFHHWSIISPLANIVAITLVSLWVVPWLFAAALLSFLFPALAAASLYMADQGLNLLWWWLHGIVNAADYLQVPAQTGIYLQGLAPWLLVFACVTLLLPAPLRFRPLGWVLLITACTLPPVPPSPLRLVVLDVGQGLAVVVITPDKTLVYDTGPWFGEGFNAGADIVAPFLLAEGRDGIDALVVSHSHSDHAGGLNGLMDALPVEQLYTGEALQSLDGPNPISCHSAPGWQWGEVQFEFIGVPGQGYAEGNNASCVLRIQWRDKTIVLPGDIEKRVEASLLKELDKVSVLLAPHHGSASSSSWPWVSKLTPKTVIFSAGYNNRHGHPHPDVVTRYQSEGSTLLNTAHSGAIDIRFSESGADTVILWRSKRKRYWRD